jgi:dipeptidyl aminopeptidase/acylaminoacyl peptidase
MQHRSSILKKLLVLILAFLASFYSVYFLVSMDQPARHPGLNAADLPPLIAIHELFSAANGSADAVRQPPLTPGTKTGWREPSGTGTAVNAVLTLPHTAPVPGPLPTVVLISSRSESGTSRDDERMVRFLGNRGYVVLSIHCGPVSDGLGFARIQTRAQTASFCTAATIRDETKRVIAEKIADAGAIAVIGSGMGGYLALMAMALDPSLFRAGIVHSAVMDQVISMPENRIEAGLKMPAAAKLIEPGAPGPEETGTAVPSLSALVQRIEGAVLITHGKADLVVPVEQAQRLAQALQDAGKPMEAAFFNQEGHAYSRWQTRVQVARLQEVFLAHHLGGRNGGYDYIELLAKLF